MTDPIKARVCELLLALMDRPATVRDLTLRVCGNMNKVEWVRGWLAALQDAGLAEITGLEREGCRGPGSHVWSWVAVVDPLVKQPAPDLRDLSDIVSGFKLHHGAAAAEEGWGIWTAVRDGEATAQVQRIDCPDNGKAPLESDDVALVMVATGTGEHHAAARRLLARCNPAELNLARSLAGAYTQEAA